MVEEEHQFRLVDRPSPSKGSGFPIDDVSSTVLITSTKLPSNINGEAEGEGEAPTIWGNHWCPAEGAGWSIPTVELLSGHDFGPEVPDYYRRTIGY